MNTSFGNPASCAGYQIQKVILVPFQFIQGSLYADLNGYTINNGSVGTVIPRVIGSNKEHMPLAETLRSPLSLQGHPSPGPCSTEGHTHTTEAVDGTGSRRTLTCHCNVDLS